MENKWYIKSYNYLLYAFAAFPLMIKPSIISFVVILLVVNGAVVLISKRDFTFSPKVFFFGSALFLLYVLFILLSQNRCEGINLVERRLVMLAIPLLWSFKQLAPNTSQKKFMIATFCYAALAIAVIANVMLLFKGYISDPTTGIDKTFLYRTTIEKYSGLHPTYLCTILYFAAFILLHKVTYERGRLAVFDTIAIIVLILAAVAAASRSPMIAFGVISLFAIHKYAKSRSKQWLFWLITLTSFIGMSMIPTIRNRMQELSIENMYAPTQGNDNGTNVRAGIIRCDIALLENNWLFGLGTGDVQDALNNCFSNYTTDVYSKHDYNTHNEYLNVWLTAGLLGIGTLLYLLIGGFAGAVKFDLTLFAYFFVFIFICFFTENFLDRQVGITFFVFFHTLYLGCVNWGYVGSKADCDKTAAVGN